MTQKLVKEAITFFGQFLNFYPGGLYDNYDSTRKDDLGKHWSMFNLY